MLKQKAFITVAMVSDNCTYYNIAATFDKKTTAVNTTLQMDILFTKKVDGKLFNKISLLAMYFGAKQVGALLYE